MPDKKNRQRPTQLHFYVNDKELDLIKQKMTLYGTENMSAYLRKPAIDGYVLKLELPELRELVSLMRRISNSENQIAKKLNASDKIYDTELDEINKNQEAILQGLNQIITSLAKLD
ncbi:MAG: MobC family plasmid mobilization relaxosome protein [Clostridiales bacterium]|mgnify:CR=1 FL=1|jgi:hypothetical protein|nr:MobC family plasmid mobilization relaxosome protein [Clostridiales bacterium]